MPTHLSTSLPISGSSSFSSAPLIEATTPRTRRPTPLQVATALRPADSTAALLRKVTASSLLQANTVRHLRDSTAHLLQASTVNLLKVKASMARLLRADSMASLRKDRASTVLRRLVSTLSRVASMDSSDLRRAVRRLREEDTQASSSTASRRKVVGTRTTKVRGTSFPVLVSPAR